MTDTIIGAIIGAIISAVIAEIYHRKTSRSTEKISNEFRLNNQEFKGLLENLEEWQKVYAKYLDEIYKTSTKGTTSDPEFPYK